ncbi:MAG TPA: secondary thiamine-phosphate synthase enzyme YjbQ [Acidobacteriota bacterium]|nr:secondary thiamine-phosphate synthase enzyme YjbQ [Acidobacteriota bacterium]
MTDWLQREIILAPKPRGFHLITRETLRQIPELETFTIGLVHIFLCHTSASLTINENASPDVRRDFESHFNVMVPENARYYRHTDEGPDDMPAHLKASILGSSVTLPLTRGRFNLGTWQGIYLCEHRNDGGSRRLVVTIHGQMAR